MIPDPHKEAGIILARPLLYDFYSIRTGSHRAPICRRSPGERAGTPTQFACLLQESVSTDAGTYAGMYVQVYAL